MPAIRVSSPEAEAALCGIEARRRASSEDALRIADEMIAGVRARGDAFVAEQVARFDDVALDPQSLVIEPRETAIDPVLSAAIDMAIERITAFHRRQLPQSYEWKGITHRVRPLRRAGIYVPGGRAVYLSTLIMCAVPARIAGVQEMVVATTPAAAARDELHFACRRLGVRTIYRAGGAAGIAALALGTESLPRVDKIAGPGNAYVAAAKARLVTEVGIDMIAGPTELVVIADDRADPALVQADLDAQQEHGADSVVICICVGKPLEVRATLTLVTDSVEEAIAVANRVAPEHLSLQIRDARQVADRVTNCGAVFCGPFAPVAAGDYILGPNHVLPTAGSARFSSPLGVYDFVKRTNVIATGEDTLDAVGPPAMAIARLEGLPMHALSIGARRIGARP
jgi:histidinol dehydrogenase